MQTLTDFIMIQVDMDVEGDTVIQARVGISTGLPADLVPPVLRVLAKSGEETSSANFVCTFEPTDV